MARVLIIEDEPSIALILVEVLCGEGHEVETAPNGTAGLMRLSRQPVPDIVLLDLLMPVLGGRAVLEAMRSEPSLAGVPVVLITGAVPSARDFPPPSQYQALLSKPFQLGDVSSVVARCLGEPETPGGAPSEGREKGGEHGNIGRGSGGQVQPRPE